MPDLSGHTLKRRYRIEAGLGRGGMAEVYRAFDTRRHYPVAVKVLREDLAEDWDFVRRFQAEADSLARLAHQNIVRFYSFEQDGRIAFIVMDLVKGDTLRGRIFERQGRPMAPAETLPILRQVAAALAYAHAEGIIHRDVKPGNIMLRPDGSVLLSDFGISKAVDAATVTAAMPGTPAYMSPEQCRGDRVDARTDIYSLGVVLYEMLASRRPFVGQLAPDTVTGGTHERVRWEQMHASPPDPRVANPALTRGIAQVVMQALAKDPDARYPTVMAFLQAFENICEPGMPSTTAQQPQRPGSDASPPEPSPPPPTGRSMLRPALTAIGVLILATCIIASVFLLRAAGLDRRILLAVGTEPTALNTPTLRSAPLATAAMVAALPPSSTPTTSATPTATSTPTSTSTHTATSTPTASPSSTPLSYPRLSVNRTVNVRSGPGTDYPVIGQITGGTYMIAGGIESGGWWQIEFSGAYGWVSASVTQASETDTVTIVRNIPDPPTPTATPTQQPAIYIAQGRVFYRDQMGIVAAVKPDGSPASVPPGLDIQAEQIQLSPDGTLVAFTNQGRPQNIHVSNIDGSDSRRVSSNPIIDSGPAWSPDSRWLAYSANRDAWWWIINIVDVYGGNTQTIYGENATSSKPFWAPTGRRIGFLSMNNENYRTDMHFIDLESGSMTTLLRGVSRTSYVSWSPDGSTIAFASDFENPRSDVYMINTDGSNLRRLIPSGRYFATSMPVWSPDGKQIAFGALDASGWGVYVTDASGHDPRRIASGTPFAWSRN